MRRFARLLASLFFLLPPSAGRLAAQATTGAQPTMPGVVGLSEDRARARLQPFQLTVEVTTVASAQPQGTVVAQRPASGAAIRPGMRVVLSVSRGPQETPRQPQGPTTDGGADPNRAVTVPDLAGMSPTLARIAIIASRLVPGAIDSVTAEGVRAGRVVTQRPAAGAVVPPGTRVQLSLARRIPSAAPPPPPAAPTQPPPSTLVVVPDLSGRGVAEARRLVGGARLLLGEVDSVVAASAAGTVVRQKPEAGDSVQPGTFVSITIARRALVTVPRLTGLPPSEALRELSRAGLRPGALTERDAPGATSILRQSVPAGSRVAPGTAVDLVVSRAPAVRPNSPVIRVAPAVPSPPPPPPPPPPVDSVIDTVTVAKQPVLPPAAPSSVDTPANPASSPLPATQSSERTRSTVPWEWLVGLVALLLIAAALFLRPRSRGGPKSATATGAVPPIIPVVVVVRTSGGGSSTVDEPDHAFGEGRVKIGMIAGDSHAPEPEPGAAALGPGRLVVRVDEDVRQTEGAPPERVMDGAPLDVRVSEDEPVLERDEEMTILKGR